jgi:DNA (cytosine-5)-methyltransferase 1
VSTRPRSPSILCIDLFCGAGGFTHGFVREGLAVKAGIDLDAACRHAYETNNPSVFIEQDVSTLSGADLLALWGKAQVRVLAGCAPCQPFSTYTLRYDQKGHAKWGLMGHFARLVGETRPQVVTMENVSTVRHHGIFDEFVSHLESLGYQVSHQVVDSVHYGVPQSRRRMVLLASLLGPIALEAPSTTSAPSVREAIADLPPLAAGEHSPDDPLHLASPLSPLNLERIRASRPGGSWRDWPPHLVADCHRADTGKSYPSVYGRMEWDKPSPTITTQSYGFGNGRFGHPEQHRAISLREAAILQSFPRNYDFWPADQPVNVRTVGRLIGNAVPPKLGSAIARSIRRHVAEMLTVVKV